VRGITAHAERQADGSYVLNGEKRWIGNGGKDIVCVFARRDHGPVALIVEKGMPGLVGRFTYPADADGDAHSTSYDDARKLLFAADEDFCKNGPGVVPGWGCLRVIDESNPSAPVQIGEFHTQNSYGQADPAQATT
jgi:hypothetical protein